MAKLAILGHATRGKEIIEILKMLGGYDLLRCEGNNTHVVYYVDKSFDIFITCSHACEDSIIFTLEEFLEKFPYKVGDKVQHQGATSCGTVYVIEHMKWTNNHIEYDIRPLYDYNHTGLVTLCAEDLQPYKEETIEGKITMNEDKGRLVAIDLTQEIKKANEIEVILGDYEFVLKNGKTYFIKKNKYPKTYEECCAIIDSNTLKWNNPFCINKNTHPYIKHLDNLIESFCKLLVCRYAYWKIAGEQVGLGKPWEPEFRFGKKKYCIMTKDNKVIKATVEETNRFLVFPTEEMRDEFYENFKGLIEACKELL